MPTTTGDNGPATVTGERTQLLAKRVATDDAVRGLHATVQCESLGDVLNVVRYARSNGLDLRPRNTNLVELREPSAAAAGGPYSPGRAARHPRLPRAVALAALIVAAAFGVALTLTLVDRVPPHDDPISLVQHYHDDTQGISFVYPSDWTLKTSESGGIVEVSEQRNFGLLSVAPARSPGMVLRVLALSAKELLDNGLLDTSRDPAQIAEHARALLAPNLGPLRFRVQNLQPMSGSIQVSHVRFAADAGPTDMYVLVGAGRNALVATLTAPSNRRLASMQLAWHAIIVSLAHGMVVREEARWVLPWSPCEDLELVCLH